MCHILYLELDSRYERVQMSEAYSDGAVLSAVGVNAKGRRTVLGTNMAPSEGDFHWRTFLDSFFAQDMRGLEYIISDDLSGQSRLPRSLAQRVEATVPSAIVPERPGPLPTERSEGRSERRAALGIHCPDGIGNPLALTEETLHTMRGHDPRQLEPKLQRDVARSLHPQTDTTLSKLVVGESAFRSAHAKCRLPASGESTFRSDSFVQRVVDNWMS
ncbi:MAG: transposase [Calditrichaeota bacterium]|nr:transposase [Calditrichota bacterium]